MGGEINAPKTFIVNRSQDGIVSYTDGTRVEAFRQKDPDTDVILFSLKHNSTTESPNMSEKEYLEELNGLLTGVIESPSVSKDIANKYVNELKPYQEKDSDGGSEITVDEMMKIADNLKAKDNKPWYKF